MADVESETNKNTSRVVWRKGLKTILRPIEEDDLPKMNRWINDPLNNEALNVTWPLTMGGQYDWYQELSKPNPDDVRVAITTHEGALIGNMSMKIDRRKQQATTATMIGSHDHKGKGYGTDAKMLMLDYAFNWQMLRRVKSKIFGFNVASQKYGKKCGYEYVCTIPAEEPRRGQWADEHLYIVTRENWLPLWEQYLGELIKAGIVEM